MCIYILYILQETLGKTGSFFPGPWLFWGQFGDGTFSHFFRCEGFCILWAMCHGLWSAEFRACTVHICGRCESLKERQSNESESYSSVKSNLEFYGILANPQEMQAIESNLTVDCLLWFISNKTLRKRADETWGSGIVKYDVPCDWRFQPHRTPPNTLLAEASFRDKAYVCSFNNIGCICNRPKYAKMMYDTWEYRREHPLP